MRKTLAALLAFSFVMLSACGSTPEQPAETPQETTAMTTAQTETTTAAATTTTSTTTTTAVTTTATTTQTTLTTTGTTQTTQPQTQPIQTQVQTQAPTQAHTQAPATAPPAPATKPAVQTTGKPATIPTGTGTVPTDGKVNIVNGIMVVNSGTDHPRALELFSNSQKNATRYAQALNKYKSSLGKGVNVYCMVVPTSQAFYMPAEYASKYGSQKKQAEMIAADLKGVRSVQVFDTLDAHKTEPIYSRTDYHWQPLAAYYAAEEFASAAGVDYAPLSTYTSVTRNGYIGAFYRVNKVNELANAPEPFTYYKPANLDKIQCTYYNSGFGNARKGSLFYENNSINASYTVFVGTDDCILQTDTNVKNDRVLVIFKDSFGNALVPFLTQSFSRIYLCDFRYFDQNAISFIKNVGATDLLFALSTTSCTTSGKIAKVEGNLTK